MKPRTVIRYALLCSVCSLGCGGDDGPPPIAGAWVHCLDDGCNETTRSGWYFPEDGGPLRGVGESEEGELCAASEPDPIFEDSTWEETADGVVVRGLRGIGELEVERHGNFLETLNDGYVYMYPPPREYPYMAKATLGACK